MAWWACFFNHEVMHAIRRSLYKQLGCFWRACWRALDLKYEHCARWQYDALPCQWWKNQTDSIHENAFRSHGPQSSLTSHCLKVRNGLHDHWRPFLEIDCPVIAWLMVPKNEINWRKWRLLDDWHQILPDVNVRKEFTRNFKFHS